MSIFDILSLLGGLAMFLYGMRLMGDSLKESNSGALKNIMEKVTDNQFKAFLLGIGVTALIQSSTATIVITSGLVAAGILTLHQSLGIIVGANVGTTVTGQIIRLLDLNAEGNSILRFFQPSTLAPIALIIGIVLMMTNAVKNSRSAGNIAVGFGILFSGLLNMTGAVKVLQTSGLVEQLFSRLGDSPVLGYLIGAGVAFTLQSSSATIGILQAFSATGLLTFKAIYSVIVGIYLGDCVTTAIVCSIGSTTHVGILNQYYKVSTEFERLGDCAVHIEDIALKLSEGNTQFSDTCKREINVLRELLEDIVKDTEKAFCERDIKAASSIEPKVRVAMDMVNTLTQNHFKRMSSGECSLLADALFTNLMGECKRVAGICSNVGIATLVRVQPELASNEHMFFEELEKGGNEAYNEVFEMTRKEFFDKLK